MVTNTDFSSARHISYTQLTHVDNNKTILYGVRSANVWSTATWSTDIWAIDIWSTDVWSTDIWSTDIWPTDHMVNRQQTSICRHLVYRHLVYRHVVYQYLVCRYFSRIPSSREIWSDLTFWRPHNRQIDQLTPTLTDQVSAGKMLDLS